ncbi:MAG: response regulator [Anaerolineae bacterium]|nr:response regulator [Anaerolineae bacterium]
MNHAVTIAVYEPDRLTASLIHVVLQRLGYAVKLCRDAEETQRIIREERPHLALIDLYSPGNNGLRLVHDARTADVPVIVISAMGFSEVVRKAAGFGAVDFIVKPIDSALLAERVERALTNTRPANSVSFKIQPTQAD